MRRELQKLLEKAQAPAKGSYLKRFFRSTRDEETLKAIATDLMDMLQRYQVFATTVHLCRYAYLQSLFADGWYVVNRGHD